jgi:monoamine oxidase
MNFSRKSFLKKSGALGIATALGGLNPIFSEKSNRDEKIIIVGAGASGLYAGRLLKDKGFPVTIIEASSTHGGRIKPILTFSDYPIELGAEEIHGEKSLYTKLLKSNNISFFNTSISENYYMCNGTLKDEAEAESDEKFSKVVKAIQDIKTYKGQDISVESFFKKKNIDSKYFHIPEAIVGNEHGTNLNKIGMKALARDLNLWDSGSENFLLKNRSHLSAIEDIVKLKDLYIIYDFPVIKIDSSGKGVVVFDSKWRKIEGDKIIITVPLNILKQGSIEFSPTLPADKLSAIDKMGMDSGMKIIMKFTKRFWEESTGSIYSDGVIPEYWTAGKIRSVNNTVLTAYVTGDNASNLSSLGKGAVREVLTDLDRLYGKNIASKSLTDSFIMDWKKEPYIKGCYSYPILNEGNARELLANSIQEKIYFAGEAANTEGHSGTIQGALESAATAVKSLMDDL